MPIPIIAPVFPWLVSLVTGLFTSFAGWLLTKFAVQKALDIAMATAYLVAVGGLFVGLTVSLKALALGARVALPAVLSAGLQFLPGSTPQFIAALVTFRMAIAVYKWTVATMSAYLPGVQLHKWGGHL